MPGWSSQKIKQMVRTPWDLTLGYLKIIHILHPRYHPIIVGHMLKNKQQNKCVCFYERDCTINHNENADENAIFYLSIYLSIDLSIYMT